MKGHHLDVPPAVELHVVIRDPGGRGVGMDIHQRLVVGLAGLRAVICTEVKRKWSVCSHFEAVCAWIVYTASHMIEFEGGHRLKLMYFLIFNLIGLAGGRGGGGGGGGEHGQLGHGSCDGMWPHSSKRRLKKAISNPKARGQDGVGVSEYAE